MRWPERLIRATFDSRRAVPAVPTLGSCTSKSGSLAQKDGTPPLLVYEDPDGVLEISDGVTRATRIAKLAPGGTVPVIVIGRYRQSRAGSPRVKDRL